MLVVVALVAVVALVCAVIVFGGAWVVDRVRGGGSRPRPAPPARPARPERRGGDAAGAAPTAPSSSPAPPERPRSSGPAAPPPAGRGGSEGHGADASAGSPRGQAPGAEPEQGAGTSGSAPGDDVAAGAGPPAAQPPADAPVGPGTTAQPTAGGAEGADPRVPTTVTLQQLDPEMRTVYASSWQRTQERFRQEPESALTDADKLVTLLLDERGYPTRSGGLVTEVTTDPAGVVPDYVAAHRITSGKRPLTAQEMRKAMDAYRRLVSTLLEDRPARGRR